MILILGGIKTGKSDFATAMAEKRKALGPIVYLATAKAGDEEMTERIDAHRARRPAHWRTREESMDPSRVFTDNLGAKTIILDCVTNWLTNLISHLSDEPNRSDVIRIGQEAVTGLIAAIGYWENHGGKALLVSNQVETGLISPWPLGRYFQDLAGMTHQQIAKAAEAVYLMNAGLPLKIK